MFVGSHAQVAPQPILPVKKGAQGMIVKRKLRQEGTQRRGRDHARPSPGRETLMGS